MTPIWFILALLLLNLGASLAFAWQREWSFCLIYFGATIIQTGTLLWLR